MLPIDIQAEIIWSFQEEKRHRFNEMQAQQQALSPNRRAWRARLLQMGGNVLIAAGCRLQQAAVAARAIESDGRQLGWEK